MAYSDASIDELYYLATEHANRVVGAGEEAYDVKVGGMGVPLTGDDSRKSWPSTYKVRDRRRGHRDPSVKTDGERREADINSPPAGFLNLRVGWPRLPSAGLGRCGASA